MIRRAFNICNFALLKANKIRVNTVLSQQQLNGCRELFKIKGQNTLSLEQNSHSYLKERANAFVKSYPDEILRKWEQLRPIECEVNVLTFSQTYSPCEQKYVDSIIRFWSSFFLANKSKYKHNDLQRYKQALLDYITAFNNLIYLMTINSTNLLLYLSIYNLTMDLKITKQKYFSSLRYVFDGILALPQFQNQKLDFFIFFTSKTNPHLFYFTREQQIWDFIYRQIPVDWTSLKSQKLLVNILYSLTINPKPPKQLVQKLPDFLQMTKSPMLKYRTFCFMVEYFMIDRDNIREKQFLEPLKLFVKEIPQKSMRSLAKMFYRAQIWVPQFWQAYFSYMSINDNYKQIDNVDHHIIDDLLVNGEGGQQLKTEALKFRNYLRGKGLDIANLDCKLELQKLFGRIVNDKSSCQQTIANSLRLICKAEVVTEVSIKYFHVDIVVDKKIAIEINSGSHYKYIDGKPVLNLKSRFRQRVLKKEGYVCKNIHVEDFTLSNYYMMDDIYKIVESSAELKAKITQPRHTQ